MEKYTNSEIIGDDDYGVAHGVPQDPRKHSPNNMPPERIQVLGLEVKGINGGSMNERK